MDGKDFGAIAVVHRWNFRKKLSTWRSSIFLYFLCNLSQLLDIVASWNLIFLASTSFQ